MGDSFLHIALDVFNHFIAAILGILVADFCGDGEAGRHRHAQQIHFSKVSTLAAEDVAHPGITFGFSVAECIDLLCHLL